MDDREQVTRLHSLEVWECPLPMPYPLRLGAITYATREYVVVRATADDGATGSAIGYTRHTPLMEALQRIFPAIAELDVTDPRNVLAKLRTQFAPGWPGLVRAASLIDIALWEMKSIREDTSLARALGGSQPSQAVSVMAVAGYFADQRTFGELVDEACRFVDEGYSTVKLILGGVDRDSDERMLREVRKAIPDQVGIGVDFHGAFESVEQAKAHCEPLLAYDPAFIEDPFSSRQTGRLSAFANSLRVPVAAGEDLIDVPDFENLLMAGVRALRIDVTASGGYSTIDSVIAGAAAQDAIILPHVWPHSHAPLVASCGRAEAVEVIPPHVGADPLWSLLASGPPVRDGIWDVGVKPGPAMPVDFDAVRRYASRSWTGRSPECSPV